MSTAQQLQTREGEEIMAVSHYGIQIAVNGGVIWYLIADGEEEFERRNKGAQRAFCGNRYSKGRSVSASFAGRA